MSKVDSIYAKKYDVFTYLGWAACGVLILWQLFQIFIINQVDYSAQQQIYAVMSYITPFFASLLVVGYANYVLQLPEKQKIPVGGLLAVAVIFRLINAYVGINWGGVNFLKYPLLRIPTVILCVLYWKHGIIPKLLTGVHSLRILLQLIIGIIGIFSSVSTFLYQLSRYILLLSLILIAIWFYLGIPDLEGTATEHSHSTTTKTKPKPKSTEVASSGMGTGNGIPPSTSGWTHGMPRLAFWCETCDKKINYRVKNNDDIGNTHPCPTCGTTLKAWWVEPTRDSYFKFIGGGILEFGGMMTLLFATIGNYGVDPLTMLMVLSIIEMAIGIFIMYSGMKLTHTEPPAYATTKVSLEPQKVFIQEMIILVVIIFVGAAIVYGINGGLLAIVFG